MSMEDVMENVIKELNECSAEAFKVLDAIPKRHDTMEALRQAEKAWKKVRDLADNLTIKEL